MIDVVDAATRSRMMAGIRAANTRPEIALRQTLHKLGFRYRLHGKTLPGRPDVVLSRHGAIIFVHGCFWHRHRNCRFATTPATRPEFWLPKLEGNAERDKRNVKQLLSMGWRVAIVWECAIKSSGAIQTASRVAAWIRSGQQRFREFR